MNNYKDLPKRWSREKRKAVRAYLMRFDRFDGAMKAYALEVKKTREAMWDLFTKDIKDSITLADLDIEQDYRGIERE